MGIDHKVKSFPGATSKELNLSSKMSHSPTECKQWIDQQIHNAMEAASSGNVSISKASEMYSVWKTTLKDRLSGWVVHGTKPVPRLYLHSSEERVYQRPDRRYCKLLRLWLLSKKHWRKHTYLVAWFLKHNPAMSLRARDTMAGVKTDINARIWRNISTCWRKSTIN